jgi:hypothetical protein
MSIEDMEKIKKYLKNPTKHKLLKLNYNEKEKESFKEFTIRKADEFEYFGKISDLDTKKIKNILDNQGENKNTDTMTKAISKLSKKIVKLYGLNHVWISLRIQMPSELYNIPRWHQDGKYFTNLERKQELMENKLDNKTKEEIDEYIYGTRVNTKFVTTLKGPGTLYIPDTTPKQVEKYYSIPFEAGDKYRKKIANIFKNNKVKQVKVGQGLIFIAGEKNATMHSEPAFSEPRMFLSILPCNKEELNNLKKRWNK